MSGQTIALTDPARELTEMFVELQSGKATVAGSEFLADKFGVKPWSQDFYKIVAAVMDRLAQLSDIIGELPLDDDYRAEMVAHVQDIALAFGPNGFQNAWHQFGADKLSARNLQPLKGLSGLVRQRVAYRKLSSEELDGLRGTVSELVEWLKQHQLVEQDFIRQALIDGLENLQFRLVRLRWLGWGYTLDSLREVIAAYMLLERQDISPQDNPDAAAALRKVGAVIKEVYEKVQVVKTAAETGDWLLKAYGAATLAMQVSPTIKGLLTGP